MNIPTGLGSFDAMLGGGLPRGKYIILSGLPASGKTTLCLNAVANANRLGLKCAWFDLENAYEASHAASIGVTEVDVIEPDFGEQAAEQLEKFLREKKYDLIIFDSAPAVTALSEREAEYGAAPMMARARLISTMARKILVPLRQSGTAVVFTNHLSVNIMGGQYDPFKEASGNTLAYYSSAMFRMKRLGQWKEGEDVVGVKVEIGCPRKNRLAPSGQKAELRLNWKGGFSSQSDKLSEMLKNGEVTRKGRFWYKGAERVASSEKDARVWAATLSQ